MANMKKEKMENKLLSDQDKIEALIKTSDICRLGINDGKRPYVVPLSFGYCKNTLYFHSGPKGKKLNLLKADPNVCFEIDRITETMENENPCSWDMKYQSIIGSGKVEFIEDIQDKINALKVIVSQYTDRQMCIPEARAGSTMVFKVTMDNISYKQNPA